MEEHQPNNHDLNLNQDLNRNYEDDAEERSGVGGSRWNPTKEQIEMLERIYSLENIQTPSAAQIQQITARLRVYGHIEGKNVFYWFQNHKARQRQKQRHERLLAAAANNNKRNHQNVDHIARFLAHPPTHPYYHLNNNNPPIINALNTRPRPIVPAAAPHHPAYLHHYLPNPNVMMCSPYYQLPQANIGYHNPPRHHYSAPVAADHDHQVMTMKKRSSKPKAGVPLESTLRGYCAAMMNNYNPKSLDHHNDDYVQGNSMGMTTLDLFPVHPTGILEHKVAGGNNNNSSAANSCATSCSSDTNIRDLQHQDMFDLFSSHRG